MSIFSSAASRRNLYHGYGDLRGSQRRADHFSARLGSRMGWWGQEASVRTKELTSGFKDPKYKDVLQERDEAVIKEAEDLSATGVAMMNKGSSVGRSSSLREYVKKTQQRRQNLQQAQQSLTKANELYKNVGAAFRYNETGYTPLNADADQFYDEFDQAVERRKQEYAEMYGKASFEDMASGYGQQQDFWLSGYGNEALGLEGAFSEEQIADLNSRLEAVESIPGYPEIRNQELNEVREAWKQEYLEEFGDHRAGQRDVMDMVMSDVTGMSYEDLAALNLWGVEDISSMPGGHRAGGPDYVSRTTWENMADYTGEQLEGLREFYAETKSSGISKANEVALAEDAFRRRTAEDARSAVVASQKKRGKIASERLSKSKEGIQMELRELDENFMKNIGEFTDVPKKRKVPRISFAEDRPI